MFEVPERGFGTEVAKGAVVPKPWKAISENFWHFVINRTRSLNKDRRPPKNSEQPPLMLRLALKRYNSFCILVQPFRFARRCHLTEEIGARRRELYGSDTFKPIDDHFTWPYVKPTMSLMSEGGNHPKGEHYPHVNTSSSMNQETEVHLDEQTNESIMLERQSDLMVLRVTNTSLAWSRPAFEKAYNDIRSMMTHRTVRVDVSSILEEYLCLYNKYRMDGVLSKMSGTIKNSPPLRVVRHYDSLLALPDPADLQLVQEAIDSKDSAEIPRTLWSSYLVCLCFFHHPVVKGLIEAVPKPAEPSIRTLPVSKKSLKEIRKTLPDDTVEFLYDILRAPAVDLTRPTIYRAKLVIDRARATGDTQKMSAIENLVSFDSLNKLDLEFTDQANLAFRDSLFS